LHNPFLNLSDKASSSAYKNEGVRSPFLATYRQARVKVSSKKSKDHDWMKLYVEFVAQKILDRDDRCRSAAGYTGDSARGDLSDAVRACARRFRRQRAR
jgi:hypothetical protein